MKKLNVKTTLTSDGFLNKNDRIYSKDDFSKALYALRSYKKVSLSHASNAPMDIQNDNNPCAAEGYSFLVEGIRTITLQSAIYGFLNIGHKSELTLGQKHLRRMTRSTRLHVEQAARKQEIINSKAIKYE